MSRAFAPRTCSRCGRDYFVKAAKASLRRHRTGVCDSCKAATIATKPDPWLRRSDYSHIKPIADADDDTRPIWQYRTPTGVLILLPGDVKGMTERLGKYWAGRLHVRVAVRIDTDDDQVPTGTGLVIDANTRRIYDRVQLRRIEIRSAA